MYCLPVSSLLVPSTQFLALFYYLQFPYAIDKLYRVHCPRSGHVHPRKHIVPITSLLLRFSSQDRSCSVHLPCSCVRSSHNPRKTCSVVHLPSTLPIYASSSRRIHMPAEVCPPTIAFSFDFHTCCFGALWSIQWICYKGCLLPLVCTLSCFPPVAVENRCGIRCPVPSSRSLHNPLHFP